MSDGKSTWRSIDPDGSRELSVCTSVFGSDNCDRGMLLSCCSVDEEWLGSFKAVILRPGLYMRVMHANGALIGVYSGGSRDASLGTLGPLG